MLAALENTPTWLPVDTVTKIVLELTFLPPDTVPPNAVFHVANPNTLHWANILLLALKPAGLEFDVVPPRELYFKKLGESERGTQHSN